MFFVGVRPPLSRRMIFAADVAVKGGAPIDRVTPRYLSAPAQAGKERSGVRNIKRNRFGIAARNHVGKMHVTRWTPMDDDASLVRTKTIDRQIGNSASFGNVAGSIPCYPATKLHSANRYEIELERAKYRYHVSGNIRRAQDIAAEIQNDVVGAFWLAILPVSCGRWTLPASAIS